MKHAIVLAAVIVLGCGATPSPTSSSSPAASAPASPSAPPSAIAEGFPTEVLGMPVLSVGGINQLIAQGKLDGRVAAVGGWWIPVALPSCPAPSRRPSALQAWCGHQIFASQAFAQTSCTPLSNGGGSCHSNPAPPGTETLEPFELTETNVGQSDVVAASFQADPLGVPMVLIGHVGDARQWDCPPAARPTCGRQFVIDRFAWVDGHDLSVVPATNSLQTRLTGDEAVQAAGIGANAVVLSAMHASDAPSIDPRLHGTGDAVVWLVRTVADAGADTDDPTRAASVSLVDDSTGTVLQSLPLALGSDPQLSTVNVQATTVGDCCASNVLPFYGVDSSVEVVMAPQWVGSPNSVHGFTRYGPDLPAVLDPGVYTVQVWRAMRQDNGESGPEQDACSTQVTLAAGQDVRLEAAFPKTGACSFVTPTFEDPFGG